MTVIHGDVEIVSEIGLMLFRIDTDIIFMFKCSMM
jgi:hypothetical protein